MTRTVDGEEYRRRLREKLRKEAVEFRERGDPAKLADVQEVIAAIRDAEGIAESDLDRLREEKAEERGRFDEGVVLERVE